MLPAASELTPAGTTRRTLLKAAAMGALGVPALAACSSGSRLGAVRFYQSKPEVVGYFDNLVAQFNKQNLI
jgi:raffinose/stachyose/melibiose transport system substrate-binding protein